MTTYRTVQANRSDIDMKINENGRMTVYMVGHGDVEYEIERPEWLSKQGWKEIVSKLFEIRVIQDLIKSSEFYKSGEITDLIVD
jgi:hypothetical protein